MRAEDP
jgi:hypothetical protein